MWKAPKLIIILLIFSKLLPARTLDDNRYTIVKISSNQGLSNSAVNCVFEDHEGIIWIGTWDGLNRFNGNDIELFKPQAGKEHSISHHIIRNILEDKYNRLWVSTDQGINRFDRATRQFERFFFRDENIPIKENSFFIEVDGRKNIFCAVDNWGLGYFSDKSEGFIKLAYSPKHIRDFRIVGNDHFWIIDQSGTAIYGKIVYNDQEAPEFIELEKTNIPSLDIVQTLSADDDQVVFRDMIGDVYRYRHPGGSLTRLKNDLHILNPGDLDSIYYHPGRIMPGTKIYGLLGVIQVLSSWKSSNGILWLGTDGHGIIKVFPNNKLFHVLSGDEIPDVRSNAVRAILPARDDLWLGTKGGGLLKVSSFEPGKPVPEAHIKIYTEEWDLNKNVFALAEGPAHEIWIGSDDYGIAMIDPETNRILKIAPGEPAGALFKSVYCIIPNNDGSLWLGTSGYGLIHIKLEKTGNYLKPVFFKQYQYEPGNPRSLSHNIIYTIYPAKNGDLWIGTRGGGLNYFNAASETFSVFKHVPGDSSSLCNNDVLCIQEDDEGRLWIGTSGGLSKISHTADPGNIRFQSYTEADGLKNNTVHGILTDELGSLWLSTNNGVSRFNPWSEIFKSYSYQDGLQGNEFADGAYFRDPGTNMFYFGGVNGLTCFQANQIKESSLLPKTEITSLEVLNSSVPKDKGNFYANIINKKRITLKHDENYFKVSFSAINYIHNEKCVYKYQLTGFDNNWLYTDGQNNSATYSNIPPGSYTFTVLSSNEDGYWSSVETSFDIEVLPPIWKSDIAWVLYIIFAGAIGYLIVIILKKRSEFKNAILIEKLKHEKDEEVYNSKIQFFTNITHEFCTPLTLITSPAEKLYHYEHADNYIKEKSTIIQDNAKRLLSLFQELLAFRKIEDKEVELSIKDVDIVPVIENIARQFNEITEQKGIRFIAETPSGMLTRTDTGKLEKIILNLLSNSFKHTSRGDLIKLELKETDDHFFEIELSDTGEGIDDAHLPYIFDRYNSFENHESSGKSSPGIGIGLSYTKSLVELLGGSIVAESERGQGCTFTVRLPQYADTRQQPTGLTEPAAAETLPEDTDVLRKDVDILAEDSLFGHLKDTDSPDNPALEETLYHDKNHHSPKLLIVDDQPAIRHEIKEVFMKKFAVYEASNASDGLKFSKVLHPDLMILDVIMPGKSGLDLCLEIRKDFHLSHVPVILLTAKTTIEQEIEGLNSGADAYIRKPFRTEHLSAVVESVFQNRQRIKNFFKDISHIKETIDNGAFSDLDKDFLDKTIGLIEANIEKEDISIHFICERLSISKMQFYRKLKDLTGKSPAEFIRNIKLLRSAELLKKSSLTIKEIYFACGFNNRSYFCREFKNSFGLTPSEYRQQKRSVVQ